ncbi:hypothetical protein Q31b_55750 [Novipirellula aureliae]|uniref:Secreted protein n=1 Tax=Novipirellula aureliae TaxID=2527966 RepID=A0A5C6DDX6_9BACT|nr:hypothetical protein [Novipirellula aureliae]TWU34104.1 hypothetical protein Q31b_55750 [Novipirellula aureliae]
MIMKLVNRSSLLSILLGCLLFSFASTVGCGNSGNSVPEVTKDEIADYERKMADLQAKADEEEMQRRMDKDE